MLIRDSIDETSGCYISENQNKAAESMGFTWDSAAFVVVLSVQAPLISYARTPKGELAEKSDQLTVGGAEWFGGLGERQT